ncbi:MAG TPA: serine/threonine-protein kinase [Bryobacteraceae bacterium]|jgi:serine/threonine-protein kinase|nr:serine/threonine-protein kinase [Bryobacteraceae bacterium]
MKGLQLGTYILEDKLGEGGMAEVWRARNPVLNTYAAVKFLVPRLAGIPDIERRFLDEGKRQAALQHPNIVSAFDFHYVDNRSFLVMRYVDGENLEQRLFRLQAPMPLSDASAISRDVLSALEYAHSQGVVHRDIKPSNLLIERTGRVHVMDFGIALVLGQERLTQVNVAIGTPHYMSPEQIVGSRMIDGRSDIYSFGCVLYEVLTGVVPYEGNEQDGNTDFVVKDKHLRAEPAPPSQLNPAIPDYVEQVILRCLAKKPDDRYRSCTDVLAALSGVQAAPSFVTRTPTVFESFHPPTIAPPSRAVTSVAPSPVSPPRPLPAAAPQPSIPESVPGANARPSGKGPLWKGVGLATAILLSAGGYFAFHHGNDNSDTTLGTQPHGGTEITKPPDNSPVTKAPPPERVNPPIQPDIPPTQPTQGPSSAESKPEIVDVDKLLNDGKAQLANHDEAAARESFRKAADAGNSQAMVLLASMYSQGLGGSKSDSDAVRLFQQAADLGYPRGMYNLGVMYEADRGVPESPDNLAKAASWYQKAVDRGGSADAAYRLGLMYEQGRGVSKDLVQARRYYEKSGTPEARARLAALPPQ